MTQMIKLLLTLGSLLLLGIGGLVNAEQSALTVAVAPGQEEQAPAIGGAPGLARLAAPLPGAGGPANG